MNNVRGLQPGVKRKRSLPTAAAGDTKSLRPLCCFPREVTRGSLSCSPWPRQKRQPGRPRSRSRQPELRPKRNSLRRRRRPRSSSFGADPRLTHRLLQTIGLEGEWVRRQRPQVRVVRVGSFRVVQEDHRRDRRPARGARVVRVPRPIPVAEGVVAGIPQVVPEFAFIMRLAERLVPVRLEVDQVLVLGRAVCMMI